jgi:hypothetical protein
MTLVLVLANRDQVVQLSDRRLTTGGQVMDEESGKSGTLVCVDARFVFGLCGLARTPRIEIRRWLLNALSEASGPECTAHRTLERLAQVATRDFAGHSALRALPTRDKLVAFLFSGYLHANEPPMIGSAIVTNQISPNPGSRFIARFTSEKSPRQDNITYVQRIGAHSALRQEDVDSLRAMLADRKPARAIIGKATETMLTAADRPEAHGTIGKQIDWLRLPAQWDEAAESGGYSNVTSYASYIPSHVVLTPQGGAIFDGLSLAAVDPAEARPLAVRKVGRNAPCPCGSGQKYKRCHGPSA